MEEDRVVGIVAGGTGVEDAAVAATDEEAVDDDEDDEEEDAVVEYAGTNGVAEADS